MCNNHCSCKAISYENNFVIDSESSDATFESLRPIVVLHVFPTFEKFCLDQTV